jgi:hypothetical protein
VKNATADQLAADWLNVLVGRWEAFAPDLSRSQSVENALAAALACQLRRFVPDGEGFVFQTAAGTAAHAALLTDDALYETAVSDFDRDSMHVGFRTRGLAFADFSGAVIEVEYLAEPSAAGVGGHMENWAFRFGDERVEVATYGMGEDRAFPRQLAAELGWPVPARDD